MRIPFPLARAVALALISTMGLAPISAQALSLATVENLAMQHNPSLAAARKDIAIARGLARQDRLWPNPRLNVSGGTGNAVGSPGEFNTRILVTQPIPLTSRIARHAAVGRSSVRRAYARLRTRIWQVRSRVALTYTRWRSAGRAITELTRLITAEHTLMQLVAARVRAAQISPVGASGVQLLGAQARLSREIWRARVHETKAALIALMGCHPRRPWSAPKPSRWRTPTLAVAIASALAHRADLRLAEADRRYRQSVHRYQRARRLGWMTIGAGVALDRQVLQGVPPQPIDRSIELSASLPLPFWNRNQGNRAAAAAQVVHAQARVRALRWRIRHTVARKLFTLQRLQTREQNLARLRNEARSAAALALEGLKLGQVRTASALAVLTDQFTLTTAWLKTRAAIADARMALRITLGGPKEAP